MSIEQTNVIDFISVNDETDAVVLTISDHLNWDESEDHLFLLQEKLNSYLRFVESGEMLENYPKARSREVSIRIIFKHAPDDVAKHFLKHAADTAAEGANITIEYEVFQKA